MNSQRKHHNLRRGVVAMNNYNNNSVENNYKGNSDSETVQTHTHEFESSTKLAEENDDRHNHRFAGVTSEVIPIDCHNHKHGIFTLTDFFGHLHEVAVETGPAINVGNCKHVHFVKGNTTLDDGHFHEFAFTTLIEAPLLPIK
jgi:hypothetical protein